MRLPQEEPARGMWLAKLCPGSNECILKDPRVSIPHFSQNSIVASNVGRGPGGATVTVRLIEGALPTVTNDDMERAAKGSLGRSLRYKAVLERHAEALVVSKSEVCELKATVARLKADAAELAERLKSKAERKEDPSRLRGIDDRFLIDKKEEAVKCMTGLISHTQLLVSSEYHKQYSVTLLECNLRGVYHLFRESRRQALTSTTYSYCCCTSTSSRRLVVV